MPQCEGINYVSGNFTSTPTKECIEKGTEHPMAQYIPFTIEEEHPDNLIDSAVNELEEGEILSPTNIQENADDDPNRILTRMIEWPKYSTSNTESGYFGEITGHQGFGRIPDTAQPKDNADNINPKYSGWYDFIKKVQEKKDTNCTIDTNEGTDPTLPIPGTSSANNASVFKPIQYDYDHQYHNIASLDPVVCKRNLMAVIGDHGYASRVEDDANEVVGNGNTICNTNNEVTESMYRIEDNNEAESYCLHIPEVQDPSTEDTFNAANTAEIHSINDDINALVTGQLEFGTDNVAMENENATKDCHLKKKLQNHSNIEKEFTEGDRAEESHYNNSNRRELNLENAEFIELSPSIQAEHDALDKLMERCVNISSFQFF